MEYHPRIVDSELAARLRAVGVVILEGPKAVGKTATALQQAKSDVRLDSDVNARLGAEIDPKLVLEGQVPRLIDEWQVVPGVWNAAREEADNRGGKGQFILTGSAMPPDDVTRHTGAGRIGRIRLRTMSLAETGQSSQQVSIKELLHGAAVAAPDTGIDLKGVADVLCRGGWPSVLELSTPDATIWLADYLEEISRTDIRRVDGIARDPNKVRAVVRSLARNIAAEVPVTTIAADAGGSDGPMRVNTVNEYLTALERLMLLENQEAWAPHLASRARLRHSPKRHFVDPSLGLVALGMTPSTLLKDLTFMGSVFESMVVRDLRVYTQSLRGRVLHFRDNTGREVDAILELPGQEWAALQVKLGAVQIGAAADSLKRFVQQVDLTKCGPPAFLAVVVPTGPAYTRDDGIHVLPIGSLGP